MYSGASDKVFHSSESFLPRLSYGADFRMSMANSPVKTAVVHPLVLLNCVDHYNRVAKNTSKRVVGVLLGKNDNGDIDITK
jgi:hypothetical protein